MTGPLRIAIDLRPLLDPYESGVKQYTRSMVQTMMKRSDLNVELFYQASQKDESIHACFPEVRYIQSSNSLFHLRAFFAFPSLPQNYFRKKPDLVWIPDRRPFYRTDCPLVMTIHDQVPEKFKSSLSLKSKLWHLAFPLKRLLKLCSGVLLPSSSAGVNALPVSMKKEITYEGSTLSKTLSPPRNEKQLLKRPYFLCISPADPRKRLSWILQAAQAFPRVHFVIVGLKSGDRRFAPSKLKKQKNLFLYSEISEAEKSWFLKHAQALLSLSLHEGFDLPVLEAVRAACPVIMSDIAVHHELYRADSVRVSNFQELRIAIHRALQGELSVPKPRGDYTWEAAANRALLLFRRVLRDKNG